MTPSGGFNWIALIVLICIALLPLGALSRQGIIFAIGIMGLVFSGMAKAWSRVALEELSYDLTVGRSRAEIGEAVPITVSLVNRKLVPLAWVKVDDEFPEAVKVHEGDVVHDSETRVQSLRQRTSIGWYERIRWDYTIACTRRGLHQMGPAIVESGDPFGFIRTQAMFEHQGSILVLPRVVSLTDLGLPAIRPLGEVRGGDRIFEDVTRPAGLRDYQKGDSLTRVDWKATAKARKLLVRTFDPSSTVNVIIAVAVDTRVPHWRTELPEDLDRVVTAAASVANYVAERDYAFGLFANNMAVHVRRSMRVPLGQGPEQLGEVMGALATIPPMAAGPMSAHLAEHGPRFPMGSALVLCTALITEEMVATLDLLAHRSMNPTVLYVGDSEPPDTPARVRLYSVRDYLLEMEAAAKFGGQSSPEPGPPADAPSD